MREPYRPLPAKTALPLQPRQQLFLFRVEVMGQDWLERSPKLCRISPELARLRIALKA